MRSSIALCLLAIVASPALAARKTLVVCSKDVEKTHSKFFDSLKGRDHELTFKRVGEQGLSVNAMGERAYDNLILFAPTSNDFGSDMSASTLMEFMDNGGNILMAADVKPGLAVQELARHAGFQMAKTANQLIDHFNRDAADTGDSTLISLDVSSAHAAVVGPQVTAPVLYRGIGFVAAPRKLSFVVAKAADTAYAGTAGKRAGEAPACTGSDCAVVGAMQARNNARFLLVGSLEALADALMTKASGNAAFAEELSEWAFGEKSLLRVKSTAIHNLAPKHPGHYTVKDEAEYEIVIEELAGGAWRGYAGHDDVQLRYTRMDPFVITRLTPGPDGKYSTRFILPDVYGLFTFKVNYHKTGYSNIDAELVEVIRPLRTTHHERFLFGAYPYYVSAFSMMVGVFAVSFVFLYHRDQTKAKAE